jgi:hypothetical protein
MQIIFVFYISILKVILLILVVRTASPNSSIIRLGKMLVNNDPGPSTTISASLIALTIMTQKGETEHFSDADHIRVLHKHLKSNFIDTVLVNTNIDNFRVCRANGFA